MHASKGIHAEYSLHARASNLRMHRHRGSVHYEAEILLRLDDNLEVDSVSLGLDLTLRDLQGQLKKAGHPWEVAKVGLFTICRCVTL